MSSPFSPDYSTARQRFRALGAERGWALESYEITARSPDGEVLTTDVARLGEIDAPRCLVLSSGLHGVEGYFGSAVQLQFLEKLGESAPDNETAIVLIHALNPFGFAWLRRVDEENIDPNRNFLLPGQAFEGSPPGYADLDELLNPQHPPMKCDLFAARAALTVARRGMKPLKQAVAGGQYDFPRGLFFGGKAACATQRILAAHFAQWIGAAKTVLHLDFHTGLGKWATHKLLTDQPLSDAKLTWLAAHFGASRIEPCNVEGVSYEIRGALGSWCQAQLPGVDYTQLGPEFGTYGPLRIVSGLRAENQAHNYCQPNDPCFRQAKDRLAELFCPASPTWRRKVLADGMSLAKAGLRALCS